MSATVRGPTIRSNLGDTQCYVVAWFALFLLQPLDACVMKYDFDLDSFLYQLCDFRTIPVAPLIYTSSTSLRLGLRRAGIALSLKYR